MRARMIHLIDETRQRRVLRIHQNLGSSGKGSMPR